MSNGKGRPAPPQPKTAPPAHPPRVLAWRERLLLERHSKAREAKAKFKEQNIAKKRQKRETRHALNRKKWESTLASWPVPLGPSRAVGGTLARLCQEGIPPVIRGRAWLKLIGGTLEVSHAQYTALLRQSTNMRSVLEADLPRTFPHLGFFHNDGPLATGLEDVLVAYGNLKPEPGYVQGMSYLAAVLLLYMEPYSAFLCIANMLQSHELFALLCRDSAEVRNRFESFQAALKHTLPKLHAHLNALGVSLEMFILDWVFTLFAKALPLNAAARVWDCYLCEGSAHGRDRFVWRAALGILRLLEPIVLATESASRAIHALKNTTEELDEDEYVNAVIREQTTTLQGL